MLDAGSRGPLSEGARQLLQSFPVSLRDDLHLVAAEVPDPSRQVETQRFTRHEVAKSDALDPACDDGV